MTVKECYQAFGGNYEECMGRLRTDERIAKFLTKILNDESYKLLVTSMEQRNMSEAFRAAHTLKGICLNLSLTRLYESAVKLTEALRNREDYGPDLDPLVEQVGKDYKLTMDVIAQLPPVV